MAKSSEAPPDMRILRLIEDREWNKLIAAIRAEPALADQVLRKPSDKGGITASEAGQLALHEVCKCQPPLDVVDALLEANQSAVKSKGQCGYTPLHLAVSYEASTSVVEKLIRNYPPGTRMRDDVDQALPIHLAAKFGASKNVLQEIMVAHPEGIFIRDGSGKTAQDYVETITSQSDREEMMNVLKNGPVLCKVSKAAQIRITHENETRLRNLHEAHATQVTQWEERYIQDRLKSKRTEHSLRNDLKGSSNRVDAANKQLEGKLTELISMTKMFGAQEASLEQERKNYEENLKDQKKEMQATIDTQTENNTDLLQQIMAKDLEIGELKDILEHLDAEMTSLSTGIVKKAVELTDLTKQFHEMKTFLGSERKQYNDNLDRQKSEMQTSIDAEMEKSRKLLQHVKEKDSTIGDLEEKVDNLECTKTSLVANVNANREVINMMVEEIERIPMLEGVIESRTDTIAELEVKVEVIEQAIEILSKDVEHRDKILSQCKEKLNQFREERKSIRGYNSELLRNLNDSQLLVGIYKARTQAFVGWFKEMADNVESWSVEEIFTQHLYLEDSSKRLNLDAALDSTVEDESGLELEEEKAQGQDGGVEVSFDQSNSPIDKDLHNSTSVEGDDPYNDDFPTRSDTITQVQWESISAGGDIGEVEETIQPELVVQPNIGRNKKDESLAIREQPTAVAQSADEGETNERKTVSDKVEESLVTGENTLSGGRVKAIQSDDEDRMKQRAVVPGKDGEPLAVVENSASRGEVVVLPEGEDLVVREQALSWGGKASDVDETKQRTIAPKKGQESSEHATPIREETAVQPPDDDGKNQLNLVPDKKDKVLVIGENSPSGAGKGATSSSGEETAVQSENEDATKQRDIVINEDDESLVTGEYGTLIEEEAVVKSEDESATKPLAIVPDKGDQGLVNRENASSSGEEVVVQSENEDTTKQRNMVPGKDDKSLVSGENASSRGEEVGIHSEDEDTTKQDAIVPGEDDESLLTGKLASSMGEEAAGESEDEDETEQSKIVPDHDNEALMVGENILFGGGETGIPSEDEDEAKQRAIALDKDDESLVAEEQSTPSGSETVLQSEDDVIIPLNTTDSNDTYEVVVVVEHVPVGGGVATVQSEDEDETNQPASWGQEVNVQSQDADESVQQKIVQNRDKPLEVRKGAAHAEDELVVHSIDNERKLSGDSKGVLAGEEGANVQAVDNGITKVEEGDGSGQGIEIVPSIGDNNSFVKGFKISETSEGPDSELDLYVESISSGLKVLLEPEEEAVSGLEEKKKNESKGELRREKVGPLRESKKSLFDQGEKPAPVAGDGDLDSGSLAGEGIDVAQRATLHVSFSPTDEMFRYTPPPVEEGELRINEDGELDRAHIAEEGFVHEVMTRGSGLFCTYNSSIADKYCITCSTDDLPVDEDQINEVRVVSP